MAMPSFTAAEWQERARRTRVIVERLADPSERNAMVMLARAYERLAAEAARREPELRLSRNKLSAVH